MNPNFSPTEFTRVEIQPRWMVVDDNINLLNVTRAMLEHITDALVEFFDSPTAALAAFRAAPGKYDLVITDFEMPDMDGAELCRCLREVSPALKVLLVTGSGITRRTAVFELGFCGLLPKPFMVADLEKTLADAGVAENRGADDSTKESSRLMLA